MLWESSKTVQRYDAVLGVIRDGFTVTEVAQKFGVSRQSVHTWMIRYRAVGLEALGKRSSRPLTSPAQIDGRIEARILELRRHHPSWGALHVRYQLQREGVTLLPPESSVYRALRRAGLIEEKAKRRVLPTYKRWERGRPMELWQMNEYASAAICLNRSFDFRLSGCLCRLWPSGLPVNTSRSGYGYPLTCAVFSRRT